MHIHAKGERAVRESLDALALVRNQRPAANFRPAIVHDESMAAADNPCFAALDVMPAMSFPWVQRVP